MGSTEADTWPSHTEEDEDEQQDFGQESEEGKEEEDPRERGLKNATARRRGAFRRGLVRAVMLMHDDFLAARHSAKTEAQRRILTKVRNFPAAISDELRAQAAAASTDRSKKADDRLKQESSPDAAIEPPAGLMPAEGTKQSSTANAVKPSDKEAEDASSQVEEYDPLREGGWHPDFPISEYSLEQVRDRSVAAAEELAEAERQGRVRSDTALRQTCTGKMTSSPCLGCHVPHSDSMTSHQDRCLGTAGRPGRMQWERVPLDRRR